MAPDTNSDSFSTGQEECHGMGLCLGEDTFSLLSDPRPLLLPQEERIRD